MGRKRGRRFRKAHDAQEQLEELERVQQAARQGKLRKIIERKNKSAQRFANSVKRLRTLQDIKDDYS